MVPDTTRELFRLLEPWQKYVFYALATVTVIVFVAYSIKKLIRYEFFKLIKEKGFWKRLFKGIWDASTNRTVLHGDAFAGAMHLCIFWGMVLLLIGTFTIVLDADILGMISPSLHFWKDTFYVIYSFIMDFFGLITFIGIIGMMCRRLYLRGTQMSYDTKTLNDHGIARNSILDDWVFISLLFFVIIGGFVIEGMRLMDPKYYGTEWYSFAGTLMANLFLGLGMTASTANAIFPDLWWLHGIISFIWIIYIPFSKGWHIFDSILSLTVKDDLGREAAVKAEPRGREELPDRHGQGPDEPLVHPDRRLHAVRPVPHGMPGARMRPAAISARPYNEHEAAIAFEEGGQDRRSGDQGRDDMGLHHLLRVHEPLSGEGRAHPVLHRDAPLPCDDREQDSS